MAGLDVHVVVTISSKPGTGIGRRSLARMSRPLEGFPQRCSLFLPHPAYVFRLEVAREHISCGKAHDGNLSSENFVPTPIRLLNDITLGHFLESDYVASITCRYAFFKCI